MKSHMPAEVMQCLIYSTSSTLDLVLIGRWYNPRLVEKSHSIHACRPLYPPLLNVVHKNRPQACGGPLFESPGEK